MSPCEIISVIVGTVLLFVAVRVAWELGREKADALSKELDTETSLRFRDGLANAELTRENEKLKKQLEGHALKPNALDEYQQEALKTAHTRPEGTDEDALCNWAMGLAGEAGEFCDEVKKVVFHDKALDRKRLASELGDVAWYLATAAWWLDYDLSAITKLNIEKLRERHGDSFKPHDEQVRPVRNPWPGG